MGLEKAITRKGFTLLEVLVALVILSITMAGLVNLFFTGKWFIRHARMRMTAGELGKTFLEPLQSMFIRQDTWPVNPIGGATASYYCGGTGSPQLPNPPCPNLTDRTFNNIEYIAQYDITTLVSAPNLRKVKLTMTWTEPG